jgi:hypothetical protein
MSWDTLPPEVREVFERVCTPRELDVVKLRAQLGRDGEPLGWRPIARCLNLSGSTVRDAFERARRKYEAAMAEEAPAGGDG